MNIDLFYEYYSSSEPLLYRGPSQSHPVPIGYNYLSSAEFTPSKFPRKKRRIDQTKERLYKQLDQTSKE